MPKKKTTTKKKNVTVFIVDESGSMGSIRDAAISHFNEQLETAKKNAKKLDIVTYMVKFADEMRKTGIWNSPAKDLKKLSREDYNPSGCTALFDTVGTMIEEVESREDAKDKDTSILFIIVSDGLENASQSKWAVKGALAEKIQKLQKDGWVFTYMGTDHDLTKVQVDLGIHASNMAVFSKSDAGMRASSSVMNRATTLYYDTAGLRGKADTRNLLSETDEIGEIEEE